jgi:phosphoglycolate phosphatase-like HAD superfamily hydrolase
LLSRYGKEKPHPDPILAAIAKLHADKAKSISAGDRAIDIIASKAAGITSIACLWGSKLPSALTKSGADYIARTVPDFSSILKTYFGL